MVWRNHAVRRLRASKAFAVQRLGEPLGKVVDSFCEARAKEDGKPDGAVRGEMMWIDCSKMTLKGKESLFEKIGPANYQLARDGTVLSVSRMNPREIAKHELNFRNRKKSDEC